MSINLVVLKEGVQGERRVAMDPATVSKLTDQGVSVSLVEGAGQQAGFPDQLYTKKNRVGKTTDVLKDAHVITWVQVPDIEDIEHFPKGSICVGQVFAQRHAEAIEAMCKQGISCLALELVPRITRAQSMDVLSSQATVAGYQAVLMAADLSPRLFPMLTTAAGTLRPAQVVVIGAGVAGLQAIATARRLGAQVTAYDIRPAAREQVESLGAKMIDTGVNAEGEGGYARALSDEEKAQQADVLARYLSRCDVVISTAALPGRPAPKIITSEMVAGMQAGAVVLDLAAESGGNCELTQTGETITSDNGVVIAGPLNMASRAALHASEMYARNVANLLALVIKDGEVHLDLEDEVIRGCLLIHDGELVHPSVKDQFATQQAS